jgi:hypothetical protein
VGAANNMGQYERGGGYWGVGAANNMGQYERGGGVCSDLKKLSTNPRAGCRARGLIN